MAASALGEEDVRRLFALFERYYVDVSFERFLADLREKTHVLLFFEAEPGRPRRWPGRVVGFSTAVLGGLPSVPGASFLFSGDTVVDAAWQGEGLLQRAFFLLMLRTRLRHPLRPVHWMLISKGYKTYLLLTHHFPLGFPRQGVPTPPALRRAMDAYYTARYPGAYDPLSGVIDFGSSRGAVRGRLAEPPPQALADPGVAFFLERNPGWREGRELACIAEIRWRDFARHALAAFLPRRWRARRARPAALAPAAAALAGNDAVAEAVADAAGGRHRAR
jgi:hypothetical protein